MILFHFLTILSLLIYVQSEMDIPNHLDKYKGMGCQFCDSVPPQKVKGQLKGHTQTGVFKYNSSKCDRNLYCNEGMNLFANDRFYVKNVRCSPYSSPGDPIWIGDDPKGNTIVVKYTACYTPPVKCSIISRFSQDCPDGYACTEVMITKEDGKESLKCEPVTVSYIYGFPINFHKLRVYIDGKWKSVDNSLKCNVTTGLWIGTIDSEEGEQAIGTQRIICGHEDTVSSKHWTPYFIIFYPIQWAIIQICIPIFIIYLIIFVVRVKRRHRLGKELGLLREEISSLKEKKRNAQIREADLEHFIVERWREMNQYIVESNKGTVLAYRRNNKIK